MPVASIYGLLVEDLGVAPFSDEDVCGFQVAVNDALRMRDIEGLCDVGGDGEDLIQSKRPRVDQTLTAASDGANGDVELRPQRKFADRRLGGLVAAVHTEMAAGFRAGGCFWILSSRRWP